MNVLSPKGTILERLKLDEILLNVQDNNLWESEEWIAEEQDLVRRTWDAYILARDGIQGPSEISTSTRISEKRIWHWTRREMMPDKIERYQHSHIRASKGDFEIFLGILARSHINFTHPKDIVFRRYGSVRLTKAVERLARRKHITIHGKRKGIRDRSLLKTGNYCLEKKFKDFVNDDESRVLFLQGFFNTDMRPRLIGACNTRGYQFVVGDKGVGRKVVESLYELGVYPAVFKEGHLICMVGKEDLEMMCELEIILNPKHEEMVRPQGNKTRYQRPEGYYRLVKRILRVLRGEEDLANAELARLYDRNKSIVGRMVNNLRVGKPPENGSRCVNRYLKLTDYLRLPDVYKKTKPVQRHEKWFFPIGMEVYCADSGIQTEYSAAICEEEFDVQSFNVNLKAYLYNDKSRIFNFDIDEQGRISGIEDRGYFITVNGMEYNIMIKTLYEYQDRLNLKRGLLTEEERSYLTSEFELQLDGRVNDLLFRYESNEITGILIAEKKGARKDISQNEEPEETPESDEDPDKAAYEACNPKVPKLPWDNTEVLGNNFDQPYSMESDDIDKLAV